MEEQTATNIKPLTKEIFLKTMEDIQKTLITPVKIDKMPLTQTEYDVIVKEAGKEYAKQHCVPITCDFRLGRI